MRIMRIRFREQSDGCVRLTDFAAISNLALWNFYSLNQVLLTGVPVNLVYAKLILFSFKSTTMQQSRILKICRVRSVTLTLSFQVCNFKLTPLKPRKENRYSCCWRKRCSG